MKPLLIGLIALTAIPALAKDPMGIACVKDDRAADGPYAGVLIEFDNGKTHMTAVNGSRSMDGKSRAITIHLEDALCQGRVMTLESFPVQYMPRMVCGDREQRNKSSSQQLSYRLGENGWELKAKTVSAMGNTLSTRELFAPKGRNCEHVTAADLQRVKDEFAAVQAEATPSQVEIRGNAQLIPGFRFGKRKTMSVLVKGRVASLSPGINAKRAEQMAASGLQAFAWENQGGNQLRNCQDALITLHASKGNFIPNGNGEESYKIPEILSFRCADQAERSQEEQNSVSAQ